MKLLSGNINKASTATSIWNSRGPGQIASLGSSIALLTIRETATNSSSIRLHCSFSTTRSTNSTNQPIASSPHTLTLSIDHPIVPQSHALLDPCYVSPSHVLFDRCPAPSSTPESHPVANPTTDTPANDLPAVLFPLETQPAMYCTSLPSR